MNAAIPQTDVFTNRWILVWLCLCVISFHGAEVTQTVLSGVWELVGLQKSVLKGNTVDVVPTGHQPHHRVIATNLHLGCRAKEKIRFLSQTHTQHTCPGYDKLLCLCSGGEVHQPTQTDRARLAEQYNIAHFKSVVFYRLKIVKAEYWNCIGKQNAHCKYKLNSGIQEHL